LFCTLKTGEKTIFPPMPKLSIIIPCYYNEDNIPVTTAELLENEKLFPQEVEFEYVMVDDGSKDNTIKALQKFEKEKRIVFNVIKHFVRQFK
jgi:dolichol-phosphate mannosyltransferase